jgi:hypothetical protein
MASLNAQFILDRATATHPCMVIIEPDWVWEKITPADFLLKLEGARALGGTASAEGADAGLARATRNTGLGTLRKTLRKQVRLAKKHWKSDPVKSAVLRGVKTNSNSMAGTLKQALDWEKVWAKLDATWVPESGQTIAAFGLMRTTCVTACGAAAAEGAEGTEAEGDVAVALTELWGLCVDWYGEALIRFDPETSHGKLIRDEIPTQEDTPKPDKAVILTIVYENNGATITFAALHATKFDVYMKIAPETEFTKVASKTTATTFTHTDTHGDFEFKGVGWNSRGYGPESDVASVSG